MMLDAEDELDIRWMKERMLDIVEPDGFTTRLYCDILEHMRLITMRNPSINPLRTTYHQALRHYHLFLDEMDLHDFLNQFIEMCCNFLRFAEN